MADITPQYRVLTKSGRWIGRTKTWQMVFAAIVASGYLTFAWWNRSELTFALLFASCSVFSFFLGIAFSSWLKRFD